VQDVSALSVTRVLEEETMSAKAGMKKAWKKERANRRRAWKRVQKAKPAGGGSKYARKRKP
jgi:hypothetical protein